MHFVFARHAPHTQSEWTQICFQSLFTKATAPVQLFSGWNANHVMRAYCTTSSKGLWPVASPTLWSPRSPRRLLALYLSIFIFVWMSVYNFPEHSDHLESSAMAQNDGKHIQCGHNALRFQLLRRASKCQAKNCQGLDQKSTQKHGQLEPHLP